MSRRLSWCHVPISLCAGSPVPEDVCVTSLGEAIPLCPESSSGVVKDEDTRCQALGAVEVCPVPPEARALGPRISVQTRQRRTCDFVIVTQWQICLLFV